MSAFLKSFVALALTFSFVYSFAQPANDNFADAISLSMNACSADAAFTTVDATGDELAASCWNTAPNYNVWFEFIATSTGEANITVDRGGIQGDIQRINVALWESNTVELACNRYIGNDDDVTVGYVGLTPGNTYYIAVDNDGATRQGTFTICLDDAVDYDFFEGAIDVSAFINSCSPDEAYTTSGATADQLPGSTWNTSPDYNRWFRFQATTTAINITADIDGTKGTARRVQVALWDDELNEIVSNRYVNNADDITVGSTQLTVGKWYYVSVDNQGDSRRGTFTLCLDDAVDYDYYEGAIDITGIINSCSSDAEYTTIGATADGLPGSTWNTNPDYNRWFRFVASTISINITIDIDGTKGTARRIQAALWEEDGETEVVSNRYVNNADDVSIGTNSLVPGNTYYLSVDNQGGGRRGTFTICMDDAVDYDFYEGAITLTNLTNWSSDDAEYTTIGATPDRLPGSTWNTDPDYNRWFRFQATGPTINITADRGGTRGTALRLQAAIWEEDGLTEIVSNRYVNNDDDVIVSATTLVAGNWYYLSIDNEGAGRRGTFSLLVDDTPDYDFFEGAIELTDINNWCSADAEFTTVGATADLNAASCWNTAPFFNRWFRFQATTDGIEVLVDRGDTKGTILRVNVAIWEDDGITEVECNRYQTNDDDVSVSTTGLTPGNWYYISVDNEGASRRGTFTLCVDDTPSYDYKAGALELTDLDNWCSADAEFTTSGATAEVGELPASCWNTAPNYTRWFKFNAIFDEVTIDVRTGASLGTVTRLQVALYDKDGVEVACQRYAANDDDLQIVETGLTVGEEYFISVDNNGASRRGTFTLCVNNVSTELFYSRQDGDWSTAATWSNTEGGPAASTTPGSENKVFIKGHDITVTGTEAAATLDIDVENDATSLTVNGGTLTINGDVNFRNVGNDFDGNITATAGGSVQMNTDFLVTRGGGANSFGIDVESSSSISVVNNLTFTSDAGTINNNLITLTGDGSLTIGNDFTMDHNAGTKITTSLSNTAVLNVSGNIFFDALAQNTTEIIVNNTATINLAGSFLRNGTPFGVLTFNDNSTLVLNADANSQVLSQNTGSGTDAFTYQNVTINNTRITTPQITLEGDVTVSGTLTMTSGGISTAAFTLTLGTGTGNIGTLSYTSGTIIGNFEKWVNHATSTTYLLPVGTTTNYRPAQITFNDTPTGSIIASFEEAAPGSSGLPILDNAITYYEEFTEGYWSIVAANALSSTDYDLNLEADGFDDFTITANTTFFTRPDNLSDWAADGSQVAPVGNNIRRSNVTSLSAEYAIVDDSCIEPTSSITGDFQLPEFTLNQEYFVVEIAGYTYDWTVVGGTIESGDGTNLIVVDWGAATTGSVSVVATNPIGPCDAALVSESVDVYGPIQSAQTGNWDDMSTWVGGLIPGSVDIAIINPTHTVTMVSDVTVLQLQINNTGSLDNNGFVLTVTDDYTVDGTHTSTGDDRVILSGDLTNISGTGTLDLGGRFQITGGNKFILAGSDLNITSGNLFIDSDISVFNNGTVRLTGELQGGNANSLWENRPNSSLYAGAAGSAAILATGTLRADFTDNTIYYNGGGAQDVKVPLLDEYFNLVINSTASLVGSIEVLGDLTINGSLDATTNDFSLGGVWTNSGTFIQGTSTLSLVGDNDQDFSGSFYNLTINKSLGAVILVGDLTVTNTLTLTNRNMVLGTHDLNLTNATSMAISGGSAASYIQTDNTGKIIWDVAVSEVISFPLGDFTAYSPFTFVLNSGSLTSATIDLNVSASTFVELGGSSYINRFWTLEQTGITSPDYSITYTYDDDDIIGDETIYFPHKFDTDWVIGGVLDQPSNTVTWNNLTSFSTLTVAENQSVLPIELLEFKVVSESDHAVILWFTASELNNEFYTIERSADGQDFEVLGTLPGAGDSDGLLEYSYIDHFPLPGISYYRLKQTDFDGQFAYSNLAVLVSEKDPARSLLVYPNPNAGKELWLLNTGEALENVSVQVLSLNGAQLFLEEPKALRSGSRLNLLKRDDLPAGIYLVVINIGSERITEKVIVR